MSRGPGRWQRKLLSLLAEYDLVPVINVVENLTTGKPKRSDLVAARRAAKRLAQTGQARAIYRWRCTKCGTLDPSLLGRCSCGGRLTHVLVLTTIEDAKSVMSVRMPDWISVASDANGEEATLMENTGKSDKRRG